MNKRRIGIIVLLLLLTIGFATVTTNLIVNNNVNISSKPGDFNVIFTSAITDEESSAVISSNKKQITYSTRKLSIVGDKDELEYTIKNNSSQYDANIRMSVDFEDDTFLDYVRVSYDTFDVSTPITLSAKEAKVGKITVELIKPILDDIEIKFVVIFDVNGIERNTPINHSDDVIEDIDPDSDISLGGTNAQLQYAIRGVKAVRVGRKIYIPGSSYPNLSTAIQVYDIDNKSLSRWNLTLRLNQGLAGVAPHNNGFYVLGGQNGYTQYNVTDLFDITNNTRVAKSNIFNNGDIKVSETIGDYIYFTVYHWNTSLQFGEYDINNDSYRFITNMAEPNASFVVDNQLYFVYSGRIDLINLQNGARTTVFEDPEGTSGFTSRISRQSITVLDSGVVVMLCGNYGMLYNPKTNSTKKILEGQVDFGNSSWYLSYGCCASDGNDVYIFGSNQQYDYSIKKITINV